MTFVRSSEDAGVRAVRALAREAAEAPLPELDWDRIEATLLANLERSATADIDVREAAPGVRHAASPWAVAVAAAAAAVLVYASPSGDVPRSASSDETRRPAVTAAGTTIRALEVGDRAETALQPLAYRREGVVNFTLAPQSRIDVVAVDAESETPGSMTVALSRGSIHAEVTPRFEGEIFAVEVERTRIAVHGTSFTVTRQGDRVVVDVAHGSVAVGPTGHPGSTQGWLLVGPERGVFSLDGAREAQWLGTPEPRVADATEPSVPVPPPVVDAAGGSHSRKGAPVATTAPRAAVATSPRAAELPDSDGQATVDERPPAEQERAAMAGIVKQLENCYRRQATSQGVHFSVQSSLSLTVLPNGAIREGIFDPPLSPTLMFCADKAVGAARFPRAESIRQIHVTVNLSRSR